MAPVRPSSAISRSTVQRATVDALAAQRQPHLAGPVHAVVGRVDPLDLGFEHLIADLALAGLTIDLVVVGRWGDRHAQLGQRVQIDSTPHRRPSGPTRWP